jgi:adenine-specific DNA methylase
MEYLRSQPKEDVPVMASTRHKRVNSLTNRLRLKRQRRYQPANEMEDPYIVAVLIALAQVQRWTGVFGAYFKVLNNPFSKSILDRYTNEKPEDSCLGLL